MSFFSDEQLQKRRRALLLPEPLLSTADIQIEAFRANAPYIARQIVKDIRQEFKADTIGNIVSGLYRLNETAKGLPADRRDELESILRVAIIIEAENEDFDLRIEQTNDDPYFMDENTLVHVDVIIPS